MYVCQCRAVTDGRVRAAVAAGARDPAELQRRCGAGGGCGGCLPALRAMLADLGLVAEVRRHLVDDHAA